MKKTILVNKEVNQMNLVILAILLFFICFNNHAQNSKYFTDSIYSNFLGEYRKINIYLPPNFKEGEKYPIIYATDGDIIDSLSHYKREFDSLITNGLTKPFIFVESYCNFKIADFRLTGNNDTIFLSYRNYEYVESNCQSSLIPELKELFNKHLYYFTKELIPLFESKYKLNIFKKERLFYGFSNGAGFGVNLLSKNQDIIGTYICFSTVGAFAYYKFDWDKSKKYPKLIMKYGKDEEFFAGEGSKTIAKFYKKTKSPFSLEVYQGGHDRKIWNVLLIKTLDELL
jgi:enterochelin esterase-like enzyme